MTTLSIFLYLASVLNSLRAFVLIGGILCLFVSLCIFFEQDELDIKDSSTGFKLSVFISVLCLLIACVIPNKKTMYMIAGVELTNSIMQSEDFNKVKNYLGDTGVTMVDDIKALIHAEALDAIEKTKKEN